MPTTSSTNPQDETSELCPICGGVGFLRRELPVSHPDFGKLTPCVCKQKEMTQTAQDRLYRLSNLDAFKTMTFKDFSVQGRLGLGDEQIRSLQYALSQAQQFAASPRGWLVWIGSY